MAYSIYTLSDPRNDAVRYVGLSKDVQKRFKQHIATGRAQYWVQELLNQGSLPILTVIEDDIQDMSAAREREQHWIYHYEGRGYVLENLVGNEAGHRERAERADLYKRVYEDFAHHPQEIAEQLTRMTLAGFDTVGWSAWDINYKAVVATVRLLEQKPGFGLSLNEIDIMQLTFNIFGYTWVGKSEVRE